MRIGSITNVGNKAILSADVSNKVQDWRAVVYTVDPSGADEDLPYKTFLQKVDAHTGQEIGDSILIARFETSPAQALAIDPSARFVIISFGSLFYQALDATGRPSGKLRVILTPSARASSAGAIDILEDP